MTLNELQQVKKDLTQGVLVSKQTWNQVLESAIKARKMLVAANHIIDEIGIVSGVCCCGDSMDRHASPMDCGHSPVDSGEYHYAAVFVDINNFLGSDACTS